MSKYQRGKIYKLVNNVDDEIYIGSTINELRKRKQGHKNDMSRYGGSRVYQHFNMIGFTNVEIVLIENYPCSSKHELHARERYWIDELKPLLNTHIPMMTPKEYRELHKEEAHKYYINNKDKISRQGKELYLKNRQQRLEYQKKYSIENKENTVIKEACNPKEISHFNTK